MSNKFQILLPLQQWLKKLNIIPNKNLGQNFLFDLNITNKIVKLSTLEQNDVILEIGAGLGSLTISLLNTNIKKLYTMEKDTLFLPLLKEIQLLDNRLHIIYGDALLLPIPVDITNIVANLPYNISVIFLLKVLINPNIKNIYVVIQKEVGERFISKNNCKKYGRISIFAQIFAKVEILYHLSPKVFTPIPKVDSVLVHFCLHNTYLHYLAPTIEKILKIIFNHRRKLLTTTLGKIYPVLIEFLGQKRCENLSVEDIIHFSQLIYNIEK
jgi:16S rRNA (adenine1518-N6/adenine1519-N6)-dimethyltransferase